jgi:hypothetical protein
MPTAEVSRAGWMGVSIAALVLSNWVYLVFADWGPIRTAQLCGEFEITYHLPSLFHLNNLDNVEA